MTDSPTKISFDDEPSTSPKVAPKLHRDRKWAPSVPGILAMFRACYIMSPWHEVYDNARRKNITPLESNIGGLTWCWSHYKFDIETLQGGDSEWTGQSLNPHPLRQVHTRCVSNVFHCRRYSLFSHHNIERGKTPSPMVERDVQDFNPQQDPGQPIAYIAAELFPITATAGTPRVWDSQLQSSLLPTCLSPIHSQV